MANYTPNLNLRKPLTTEKYDVVADLNDTKDKIDNHAGAVNAQLAENVSQLTHITNMAILKNKSVSVAHRGMNGLAPENTVHAFELAGKYGFWGVETDVRGTLDNELILYHNTNVEDFTDGTGSIESKTLAELQALTVNKGSRIEMYPNTKLCSFEEYLSICRKYNMVCVAEFSINSTRAMKGLQLIYDYGMEYKTIIISGMQETLNGIRALDKNIPLGFVTVRPVTEADLDYCASINPCMMGVMGSAGYLTKEYVILAHKKGVAINSYVINSHKDYLRCLEWGVDVITTDHITGGGENA